MVSWHRSGRLRPEKGRGTGVFDAQFEGTFGRAFRFSYVFTHRMNLTLDRLRLIFEAEQGLVAA
jgi:hypothetical protein